MNKFVVFYIVKIDAKVFLGLVLIFAVLAAAAGTWQYKKYKESHREIDVNQLISPFNTDTVPTPLRQMSSPANVSYTPQGTYGPTLVSTSPNADQYSPPNPLFSGDDTRYTTRNPLADVNRTPTGQSPDIAIYHSIGQASPETSEGFAQEGTGRMVDHQTVHASGLHADGTSAVEESGQECKRNFKLGFTQYAKFSETIEVIFQRSSLEGIELIFNTLVLMPPGFRGLMWRLVPPFSPTIEANLCYSIIAPGISPIAYHLLLFRCQHEALPTVSPVRDGISDDYRDNIFTLKDVSLGFNCL